MPLRAGGTEKGKSELKSSSIHYPYIVGVVGGFSDTDDDQSEIATPSTTASNNLGGQFVSALQVDDAGNGDTLREVVEGSPNQKRMKDLGTGFPNVFATGAFHDTIIKLSDEQTPRVLKCHKVILYEKTSLLSKTFEKYRSERDDGKTVINLEFRQFKIVAPIIAQIYTGKLHYSMDPEFLWKLYLEAKFLRVTLIWQHLVEEITRQIESASKYPNNGGVNFFRSLLEVAVRIDKEASNNSVLMPTESSQDAIIALLKHQECRKVLESDGTLTTRVLYDFLDVFKSFNQG